MTALLVGCLLAQLGAATFTIAALMLVPFQSDAALKALLLTMSLALTAPVGLLELWLLRPLARGEGWARRVAIWVLGSSAMVRLLAIYGQHSVALAVATGALVLEAVTVARLLSRGVAADVARPGVAPGGPVGAAGAAGAAASDGGGGSGRGVEFVAERVRPYVPRTQRMAAVWYRDALALEIATARAAKSAHRVSAAGWGITRRLLVAAWWDVAFVFWLAWRGFRLAALALGRVLRRVAALLTRVARRATLALRERARARADAGGEMSLADSGVADVGAGAEPDAEADAGATRPLDPPEVVWEVEAVPLPTDRDPGDWLADASYAERVAFQRTEELIDRLQRTIEVARAAVDADGALPGAIAQTEGIVEFRRRGPRIPRHLALARRRAARGQAARAAAAHHGRPGSGAAGSGAAGMEPDRHSGADPAGRPRRPAGPPADLDEGQP